MRSWAHEVGYEDVEEQDVDQDEAKAEQLAEELNLIQERNTDALHDFILQALAKYPEKVIEYKKGKASLLGLFMGEIMKLSKGKADPKKATQLLKEALEK